MTPERIAELAYGALVEEVRVTPKPGLVDAANSGAHRDMTLATFEISAAALRPHFIRLAQSGAASAHLTEGAALPPLRVIGKAAEADMFAATGGVNTHKGALFSIGLLCAAAARLAETGQPVCCSALCETAAAMTRGITLRELRGAGTNGLRAHRAYGAPGVRGEAESGFSSVRRWSLPIYRQALAQGENENTAALRALLNLMARVRDTNVLTRGGECGLAWLQNQAQALCAAFSLEGVREFDAECIHRNLSPGGCADLLAITLLLHALEAEDAKAPQTARL